MNRDSLKCEGRDQVSEQRLPDCSEKCKKRCIVCLGVQSFEMKGQIIDSDRTDRRQASQYSFGVVSVGCTGVLGVVTGSC